MGLYVLVFKHLNIKIYFRYEYYCHPVINYDYPKSFRVRLIGFKSPLNKRIVELSLP